MALKDLVAGEALPDDLSTVRPTPENAQLLLDAIETDIGDRNYAAMLRVLRRVNEMNVLPPDRQSDANILLAVSAFETGHLAEACRVGLATLSMMQAAGLTETEHGDAIDLRSLSGQSLTELGFPEKAIALIDVAIKANEANGAGDAVAMTDLAELEFTRGEAFESMERFTEAAAAMTAAVDAWERAGDAPAKWARPVRPADRQRAYVARGTTRMQEHAFEEAIADLTVAIETEGMPAVRSDALLRRGICRAELQELGEAAADLDAVIGDAKAPAETVQKATEVRAVIATATTAAMQRPVPPATAQR